MNSNAPFFYFKLWRDNKDIVIGQELTFAEYQACVKSHLRIHSFSGHRATVVTVTEEPSISRPSALDFAVKFMNWEMEELHIDLNKCSATTTRRLPPP